MKLLGLQSHPPNNTREVLHVFCVCLLLVLAVLVVFGQTAHFEFVAYDDQTYVFQNPVVKKGLSLHSVAWAFTHAQVSNWIPLTTLSHMLDCQIFGLQAGRHHLVNVLWHAANAVLLFLVLRQMTGSLWRSALVAALFAAHPLRAESVAWVSERKDVLSGFFFLLTIAAYVRYVRKPSAARYVAAILCFALGLMAKSMVATLPLVLLLLDYWPLGRLQSWRQFPSLLREKIPLLAVAASACVVTALMPGLLVPQPIPFTQRISNALVSYVVYLRQMFYPTGLGPHYPILPQGQPIVVAVLCLALLVAISIGVVACRKRFPCLLMGWLWFLVMMFPVIGIVQISSDAAHADRYTYLPEIGLAIAAVWAAGDWTLNWNHRRVILGGLTATWVGVLAILGCRQAACWRDDEALWSRALTATSKNGEDNFDSVAHGGLGNALSSHGKKKEAIAQFLQALRINPAYKVAHYNLGIVYSDIGEKEKAIDQYRTALRIDPAYAEARNNLGVALFATGEQQQALAQYHTALAINPDFAEARYNLGNALLQLGRRDEAIAQYQVALETTPDDARIHNNLGIALATKGQEDEAMAQYRKALECDPNFVDAHYDLGLSLVKHGKLDEALAQYRAALAIKPDDVKARLGLGKALLRQEKFDEAMDCFPKTAAANPDPLPRWFKLGGELLKSEDFAEAIICYRKAITFDPHFANAYAKLGLALFKNGQSKEAIDAWQQALQINPEEINSQKDLAWALATSPEASLRDSSKAVALAEQANQLSGSENPIILRTLAAAYAEAGRFTDAAATAQRAMQLAVKQKNAKLAASLFAEIKLFDENTPLREASR